MNYFYRTTTNTNIFDRNGHTALHTAAFHEDNPELIDLLIEYGASVNARIDGGKTAIEIAKEQGNDKVVEKLHRYYIDSVEQRFKLILKLRDDSDQKKS